MTVDISVIIPTYQRPAKLAACLAALSRQTLGPDRYEVLVGFDGPDPEGREAAQKAWGDSPAALALNECPRRGLNAVRNALLPRARGRIMVSLNDDVIPVPGFLAAHLEAHRAAARPIIISGYSPFVNFRCPTLFDRLARETSMIFFYDQMLGEKSRPADHDWGFRHCWGLNFSAPLGAVREVGGFTAFDLCYGYDDIEMSWRLKERYGCLVLFRPEALAEHDHRYGPRDVLEREEKLGGSAWRFAGINPAFCQAVFGRDIRSESELAYSREFVQREARTAERLERSFLELASIPAEVIAESKAPQLVNLIYEQHLLLKRWKWRKGLIAAAESS
jgi:GT2 family glycosyltransferase